MAQFDQTLNSMIDALGCSNKELAAACELSASALSRYRNGNRKPTSTGKTVARLAEGIASIAQRVGITEYSNAATVQQRLLGSLSNKSRSLAFADKLNSLMNTLGLYNTKLAEYIGVDASYLSRIRAGYRYPAHVREFATHCARYATLHAAHSTQAPLAALLKAHNPALSLPASTTPTPSRQRSSAGSPQTTTPARQSRKTRSAFSSPSTTSTSARSTQTSTANLLRAPDSPTRMLASS